MSGELGVNDLGGGQQAAGADQITQIGVILAGVNGIALQPIHLSALDFPVPIRAFNQPHHQAPAAGAGQGGQVIDQRQGAFLISLHRHRQSRPTVQLGCKRQAVEQVLR